MTVCMYACMSEAAHSVIWSVYYWFSYYAEYQYCYPVSSSRNSQDLYSIMLC